jgi:hypothetical protein
MYHIFVNPPQKKRPKENQANPIEISKNAVLSNIGANVPSFILDILNKKMRINQEKIL